MPGAGVGGITLVCPAASGGGVGGGIVFGPVTGVAVGAGVGVACPPAGVGVAVAVAGGVGVADPPAEGVAVAPAEGVAVAFELETGVGVLPGGVGLPGAGVGVLPGGVGLPGAGVGVLPGAVGLPGAGVGVAADGASGAPVVAPPPPHAETEIANAMLATDKTNVRLTRWSPKDTPYRITEIPVVLGLGEKFHPVES